ncbi:phage integrase N-terminal SAM-like domain-containing protein [Zhongshania sp. BJYM1]|uniref:phage integrase N-terminal SAM-like domain-containing protein n=1 Tax=Zhongshania aquatica TaxID=2965069 RepID=UPI0022B522D7|nr:phage integrase N-terminal SAM-like domain-containing protein [Marortus sp. BJYM1]
MRFHQKVHPSTLADDSVAQFLEYLVVERNVTPSTLIIAFNALMYLFKQVLGREGIQIPDYSRARKAKKLPVVLSRTEVRQFVRHAGWLFDLRPA